MTPEQDQAYHGSAIKLIGLLLFNRKLAWFSM
jgi:hypothetical protein